MGKMQWGGIVDQMARKMGELCVCQKNSHILQVMACELEAQGYNYNVVELKIKMHNMTARNQ